MVENEINQAFFASAISSSEKLRRSLILILSLVGVIAVILIILGVVLFKYIGFSDVQLSISPTGTTINIGRKGTLNSFLLHPRGWIDPQINVTEGERIIVDASGSINVAMGHLTCGVWLFTFPKELNKNMVTQNNCKPFPWNGPEGLDVNQIKYQAIKNRIEVSKQHLLSPENRMGQLLFIINNAETCPTIGHNNKKLNLYAYKGRSTIIKAKETGRLCFIINDVVLQEKMGLPSGVKSLEQLWVDNIGNFSIKVKVQTQ